MRRCEGQRQLTQVTSLLLPCGLWGRNWACQAVPTVLTCWATPQPWYHSQEAILAFPSTFTVYFTLLTPAPLPQPTRTANPKGTVESEL